MNNQKKNRPIIALAIIAILLIGVLFAFVFVLDPTKGLFGSSGLNADEQTLQQDYSSLNQLSPGSSTPEDVDQIAGKPNRTEEKNGKTYLYYQTPLQEDGNVVVISSGAVEYVFEQVFGNYRGTTSEYTDEYGEPSFRALGNLSEYDTWFVFLENGIMIMTKGERINAVAYFAPQEKSAFLNSTLAKDFEIQPLEENEPIKSGETFHGPDATFGP